MTEIEMASVTPAVRLRYKPRSRVQAVILYLSLHKVFNKFIIKIYRKFIDRRRSWIYFPPIMVNFNHFCGLGNGTFTAWEDDHFGPCFELLTFVCPANVILALSSAFLGGRRHQLNLREYPLSTATKLRMVASFLVCLEALVEIACSLLLKTSQVPVYFLTCALVAFAWLLNTYGLWNIRHIFVFKMCVPRIHIAALIFAFVTTSLQFYSIVVGVSVHGLQRHDHGVKEYGTIVRLFLQIAFILALIPCQEGQNQGYGHRNFLPETQTSVQTSDYPNEDSLLRSISQATFYSSIRCVSDDLGVAEQNSNFLSKLSFWWVGPMMLKGHKGLIEGPDDIFLLPPSLSTANLKWLFSRVFYCLDAQPEPEINDAASHMSDSLSDCGIQFSPGIDKHNNTSLAWVPKTQRSLLSSLHYAFGNQYYSIGILKLFADALGFAGPLLLHALVSFMENSKVREKLFNSLV